MDLLPFSTSDDAHVQALLRQHAISLTVSEARQVVQLIGRDPTLTELHIFNTQWSEHCSYKSSRQHLRTLPTAAPWVIQGPQEDAGIVEFCEWDGKQWGIVFGHESHNHPSQVVPYEGAATGIGGIIRDVLCMGAHVIAVADALRFGDATGPAAESVRYIAGGVVDGVAGYGNAVGVPNIAGDVYWDADYDANCLVNVVCLGLVSTDGIIHSRVPTGAAGWDVVLIGKATDHSGFGGAAFSSGTLSADDADAQKGAVQVPDPFLKSVIIRATEAVFAELRRRKLEVGFKDLGAGGISCASSEMGADGGVGIAIDLDAVPLGMEGLAPHVISCAETQERLLWIVPPEFTPRLLAIYNDEFDLPGAAEGAQAAVIGTTSAGGRYTLSHHGQAVCDVPIEVVTRGIRYNREGRPPAAIVLGSPPAQPASLHDVALRVLGHPNVASRWAVFSRYDQEVQGSTVLRPGEADAGLIAPLPGCTAAVALSTDCVPRYCRLDPYLGAQLAVAEAARNVATTGAQPRALTDCLNMGNPEDPHAFWQFTEAVRGIADAARALGPQGISGPPLPIISGNVSFYNQSSTGRAIPPTPIIACVGVIDDCTRALGMQVVAPHATLVLLGNPRTGLGGSVYLDVLGAPPVALPPPDLEAEQRANALLPELARDCLLLAAHDVSDGGLLACLAEMLLGKDGDGRAGLTVQLDGLAERADVALFSEDGAIAVAVAPALLETVLARAKERRVTAHVLGTVDTGASRLRAVFAGQVVLDVPLTDVSSAWRGAVPEILA